MIRFSLRRSLLLLIVFAAFPVAQAGAQEWSNYMHWPYTPPQNPGSGAQYQSLHDGWYLYPREQRIVPQIQGPYYRNFYGGKRILGMRLPHGLFHDWEEKKFYKGNHFTLDVF